MAKASYANKARARCELITDDLYILPKGWQGETGLMDFRALFSGGWEKNTAVASAVISAGALIVSLIALSHSSQQTDIAKEALRASEKNAAFLSLVKDLSASANHWISAAVPTGFPGWRHSKRPNDCRFLRSINPTIRYRSRTIES